MSRPPDPYVPTDPTVLLERAKARSSAMRYRRLGIGGGASVAVVVALVLAFAIGGGSSNPARFSPPARGLAIAARIGSAQELTADVARAAKASPSVSGAVERAEVGFSLRLLNRLASGNDSGNVLVSPSSLATALAMLELGAQGQTEQQIASTLGTGALTPMQQAAGWNALASALAAETSTSGSKLGSVPQLDIANGLWIQKSFPVRRAFVDSLSSEFGSGVWQADFENDLSGATAALNQWASQHTDGLIKQLFSPGALDGFTRVVLADAVYFHAHWQQSFDSQENSYPFYPPSGGKEMVQYMSPGPRSDEMTLLTGEAPGASIVELPYTGNKISALVVMPLQRTLPAYARTLTSTSISSLVQHMRSGPVDLEMPSFTLTSDDKLNDVLGSMGMPTAFGNQADLSAISPVPLQVQAVEQHAYLQVTPEGTTAAAATGVGAEISSATNSGPLRIDHPFLFLIRDNTTGAILFEAMVENPLG